MGSWIRHREKRIATATARDDYWLKPSPHFVIDMQPPTAARSAASAAAPHLVHTSTNKIRTPVNCVTWVPSSRRLLTGSSSGEFTLWNGLTFNFETILQACDSGVRHLQWSSTGNLLISGDAGGTVKYFLPNMNNVLAIDAHRESIRGMSFSPDDARWISGSDDSTIKMFNTERGVEETVMKGHGWDVKCCQWHPFKGLIASGGKDNLVKFWDPRKGGREIGTYHGHKNTIQALAFSPSHVSSGEILATASRDQTVKLYDLRMIRELTTLRAAPVEGGGGGGGGNPAAETGGVCSLAWHPSSPLLSSGLSTGSLQHHSLEPSATPDLPISTIPQAHEQSIWAMAWHPLGQILATGGNDCYTRWWQRERLEEGDLKFVSTASTTVPSAGMGIGEAEMAERRNQRLLQQQERERQQQQHAEGGGGSAFNPQMAAAGYGRAPLATMARRLGGPEEGGDDSAGAAPSAVFIPGLGGARVGAGNNSSQSASSLPFASSSAAAGSARSNSPPRRGDRPPPPPGFGFDQPTVPPQTQPPYGHRAPAGGGRNNPAATGANVSETGAPIRDSGWGNRGGPPPPQQQGGFGPQGGFNGGSPYPPASAHQQQFSQPPRMGAPPPGTFPPGFMPPQQHQQHPQQYQHPRQQPPPGFPPPGMNGQQYPRGGGYPPPYQQQ